MDFERVRNIIDALTGSAVQEVRVKTGTMDLKIRFAPDRVEAPSAKPSAPTQSEAAICLDLTEVTAPMPGLVYLAPTPSAPPFVSIGRQVAAGETLVLIEAMKSMLPVRAPIDGVIEEVLITDELLVDPGQILLRIRPVTA